MKYAISRMKISHVLESTTSLIPLWLLQVGVPVWIRQGYTAAVPAVAVEYPQRTYNVQVQHHINITSEVSERLQSVEKIAQINHF